MLQFRGAAEVDHRHTLSLEGSLGIVETGPQNAVFHHQVLIISLRKIIFPQPRAYFENPPPPTSPGLSTCLQFQPRCVDGTRKAPV